MNRGKMKKGAKSHISSAPLERRISSDVLKRFAMPGGAPEPPPIRGRIFNPELKEMARQVSEHGGGDAGPASDVLYSPAYTVKRSLPDMDQLWSFPELPLSHQVFHSMLKLNGSDSLQASHFIPYMRSMLSITGADSMGWLLYNPTFFAAHTYLDYGFDSYTRANLYVGPAESITSSIGRGRVFSMTDTVSFNMHFRKRISSHFIEKYHSAELVDLRHFNMRGYLLLFYRAEVPSRSREMENRLDGAIRDLVPYINRFRQQVDREKGEVQQHSSFGRLYRILKGALKERGEDLTIAYLICQSLIEQSSWRLLQSQAAESFLQSFVEGERVVTIVPGTLAAILHTTTEEELKIHIDRINGTLGTNFTCKFIEFPQLGHNILNYVYPGVLH